MSLLAEPTVDQRAAERARCARLIRESLAVLSSKWAVGVLLSLGEGPRRYHEILAGLEPISEQVLTQTLRSMERDGLITRHVHAEVPPRVEYALTEKGRALIPIIEDMRSYGSRWLGATAACTEAPEVVVAA